MKRWQRLGLLTALVAASTAGAGGCGSAAARQCTVGADCASGACLENGTCAVAMMPSGDAAAPHDTGNPSEASSTDVFVPPPVDGGGCLPNDDDTVARSEVFFQAGLHATFRVADNVTVDTAGTAADGGLTWDFSGALAGDHDVLVETQPVTGSWYAGSFASATYASQLDATSTLLGVFSASDTALALDGVVSPSSASPVTNVSYSPPAATLAFPLSDGSSWMSTSTVTGTAQGIPVAYTEAYQSAVDGHGTLITPYGTFHALRVAVTLTRTVGLTVTVTRSLVFVTDCFGVVATVTSQTDETQAEFTNAAEIERLAP